VLATTVAAHLGKCLCQEHAGSLSFQEFVAKLLEGIVIISQAFTKHSILVELLIDVVLVVDDVCTELLEHLLLGVKPNFDSERFPLLLETLFKHAKNNIKDQNSRGMWYFFFQSRLSVWEFASLSLLALLFWLAAALIAYFRNRIFRV
jgi:hypothetical protein